jgi:hypothetical protein
VPRVVATLQHVIITCCSVGMLAQLKRHNLSLALLPTAAFIGHYQTHLQLLAAAI